MKIHWFAAAALPVLMFGQDQMPRCDLVPGWTQAGAFRTYAADNLYDYMDGNSEGYLIYGFQQMNGVTCKKGDVSFVVDMSDMPDPESAWGLYASNRDPRLPAESLGMGGQVVPQRGVFSKGSRFVEISASPSNIDHSAAIRTFLKAIEAKLDGCSDPPAPLGWFPTEGLDAASLRLVPQSVLGLSILKRGYLAKYDYARAFVVQNASPEAATQVMAKLQQRFGDTQTVAVGDNAFQANDKYLGRLLFLRKGPYVAGFANLKDGFDAMPAAKALAGKIP